MYIYPPTGFDIFCGIVHKIIHSYTGWQYITHILPKQKPQNIISIFFILCNTIALTMLLFDSIIKSMELIGFIVKERVSKVVEREKVKIHFMQLSAIYTKNFWLTHLIIVFDVSMNVVS